MIENEYNPHRVNPIAVMQALQYHILMVDTVDDLKARAERLKEFRMTGPTRTMVGELYAARMADLQERERNGRLVQESDAAGLEAGRGKTIDPVGGGSEGKS